MAKKYLLSPFGIAVHPWINKPDTKFNADGVYKCGLRLSGPPAIDLMERIKAESDAFLVEHTKEMTAKDRKVWTAYYPFEVEEDDDGNKTGDIIFDFKQNATIKLREGGVKNVLIGMRDAKDKPMTKPIWGGSELRIMFATRGIPMTSTKQAGVRLDFAQVQVRKLQEGGGGGGFGSVEGYSEADEADAEAEASGAGEGSGKDTGGDY